MQPVTPEFEELPARPQGSLPGEHFHHWHTPEGDIVAMFFRVAGGYLLRFPGRADFTIFLDDCRVSCVPVPNLSRNVLSALYFNQVLPLLRSQDGALVLHASAARGPGGALAFAGPSGRGKSTLAASLARAGHPFLSDDGVWLERHGDAYQVLPNRAGLRLWPDSEIAVLDAPQLPEEGVWVEKSYLPTGPDLPFAAASQTLRAIYVLGPSTSEAIAIEPLNPARAMAELIKHAFILDIDDRSRLQAHFERLAGVVEAVGCFTLDYPRRYDVLPRVIEALLAHADNGVAVS